MSDFLLDGFVAAPFTASMMHEVFDADVWLPSEKRWAVASRVRLTSHFGHGVTAIASGFSEANLV